MGLFGYNKRDFEKNTEKFRLRINNIVANSIGDSSACHDFKKKMVSISVMLEGYTYNEYSKDYSFIDGEITKILDKIEGIVSKKEWNAAKAISELLYEDVDSCRRLGKNIFSEEKRKNKFQLAVISGKIQDTLDKMRDISMHMEKIVKDALATSKNDIRQKYEVEYNALNAQLEELDKKIDHYETTYKSILIYDNALEIKKFYREFDDNNRKEKLKQFVEEIDRAEAAKKASEESKPKETVCAYCGSHNYAGEQHCKQCGQTLRK